MVGTKKIFIRDDGVPFDITSAVLSAEMTTVGIFQSHTRVRNSPQSYIRSTTAKKTKNTQKNLHYNRRPPEMRRSWILKIRRMILKKLENKRGSRSCMSKGIFPRLDARRAGKYLCHTRLSLNVTTLLFWHVYGRVARSWSRLFNVKY